MKRPPSALLISPPVYDVQYWANWSMPYGLLRVASWLQGKGYMLKLIDCMEANKQRTVPKQMRCVRKLCSADESFTPDKWTDYELQPDEKIEYVFGMPLKELRKRLEAIKARARYVRESLFDEVAFPEPDEIWISSIMTYWWESTRDVIEVCRQVFPKVVFRVGGIYPTLIPGHAMQNLELNDPLHLMGRELDPLNAKQKKRDIVVSATIPDANPLPLAIELYDKDGAGDDEDGERLPDYLIMTTSRGCPFKCSYCSANVLNEGRKIWVREYEVAYDEIKRRFEQGIREFCFYEDNLLLGRENFKELCRLIRDDRDLKGIELHAPEGIEVRLLHEDTVQLMRDAGFKLRCQDINCFILFGLPDEELQAVYDTITFSSSRVGSLIPMLFTPVPSTPLFDQYRPYIEDKGFDLHHLNGKLLPFLDYNRRRYKALSVHDYNSIEGLMWRLNAKVRNASFNLGGHGRVARAFREVYNGMPRQLAGRSTCGG